MLRQAQQPTSTHFDKLSVQAQYSAKRAENKTPS